MLVELAVGSIDALHYLSDRGGLPHPIFGLVAVGVYLVFGLVAGSGVALLAMAGARSPRGGATIGASAALFLSFGALAFFRWLPEAVEVGTLWGVAVILALTAGSALAGRILATLAPSLSARTLTCTVAGAGVALSLLVIAPLLMREGTDPFDGVGGKADRQNVVLIVIDTFRADRLGVHGNPDHLTPAIDALAAEGVAFTNTLSTSCHTPPSHASLLTGTYPSRHGVKGKERFLSDANLTLPEVLRQHGYATFGVVSNLSLTKMFGWNQGFHLYDDSIVAGASPGVWLEKTPAVALLSKIGMTPRLWLAMGARKLGFMEPAVASSTIDHVLSALDRVGERSFFAFVNIMDPHYPYSPPGVSDGGKAARVNAAITTILQTRSHRLSADDERRALVPALTQLYDDEVRYTDQQLARLFSELKARGLWNETTVILTADHGEHFGEHDRLFHSNSLYKELLHVPLVIRLAGEVDARLEGAEIEKTVSLVDVTATILDLARVPAPPTLHGESLLPALIEGPEALEERVAISEWGDARAMVWGKHKAFFSGDQLERVVHRSAKIDPHESEDLSTGDLALYEDAIDRFRQWSERCASSGSLADEGGSIDPKTAERLRALGYLN